MGLQSFWVCVHMASRVYRDDFSAFFGVVGFSAAFLVGLADGFRDSFPVLGVP